MATACLHPQLKLTIDPIACRPRFTAFLVVCTDLSALLLAAFISIYGRWILNGQYQPILYLKLWPLLGAFFLVYKLRGLYPAIGLNEVEELRRLITSTTMVWVTLAATIFLLRDAFRYSRLVFLSMWLISVALLPLGRAILRGFCGKRRWWGMPVVVLGEDHITQKVVGSLRQHPELGLRPVAIFADDLIPGSSIHGVTVLGSARMAPRMCKDHNISCAVVALSRLQDDRLSGQFAKYAGAFPTVLIVANISGLPTLWVEVCGLGQYLTLRVRHGLRMSGPLFLKRSLDIFLSAVAVVLLSPFLAIVAIVVKCTSRGPAFYGHTRVGFDGRRFKAWKFRTMIQDADSILRNYLDEHPEYALEWMRDHKLKNDPRVTRIGSFLRRTSIDELPQLLNVLTGEMSLVGPRPIVEAEIIKYADDFQTYSRVPPGITGLWQVSGRSNTTYAERVEYDTYYVNNWSPWLDVYLLAKTVQAVFAKDGAY